MDHYKLTLDEIEAKVINHFDKYYDKDKNKIDIESLKILLEREFNIFIGYNKLYKLKEQIIKNHQEKW